MESFIDLRESADPTGGEDASEALREAAREARESGRRLVGAGTFRLASTVDLRDTHVDMPWTTFLIDHADGPGLLIGGNASSGRNPQQSVGNVVPVPPPEGMPPTVRIMGAKGQHIHVQWAPYIQLFADTTTEATRARDYSCAYSTFVFPAAGKVELLGTSTAEPGGEAWINENQFFLNRTNFIRIAGDYHHNHNKFHAGTMEGTGEIDVENGNSNQFLGLRFEKGAGQTLTISFGEGTWDNTVEASWQSSPGYAAIPNAPPSIVVNDLGLQNCVRHSQESSSDDDCLLDLSEGSPRLSSLPGYDSMAHMTDLDGVSSISQCLDRRYRVRRNYAPIFEGPLVGLGAGDSIAVDSDLAAFRVRFYLYDADRRLITEEPDMPPVGAPSLRWDAGGHCYVVQVNVASYSAVLRDATIVKYVRFSLWTGNGVNGQTFRWLRVACRQFKRAERVPRGHHRVHPAARLPSLSFPANMAVNMLSVAEGLPCYTNDLSELHVNLSRSEHSVVAVSGNKVDVDRPVRFAGAAAEARLAFEAPGTGEIAAVGISAISATSLTLAGPAPAEVVPGAWVAVIVTKRKALS